MKRKDLLPEDPRAWIERAKSNLARTGIILPEVYLEDLCFDAQQAAEKAIKAVFVHRGEMFPYIHDLQRLLLLLERNGHTIPKYVKEATELTRYAHVTLYHGVANPVTRRTYRRAVRLAADVLRWAERQVGLP
jgi:HEPN domain-containing protein